MANSALERTASRVMKSPSARFGIEIIFITKSGTVKGRSVLDKSTSAKFTTGFTTQITIQTMVSLYDYRFKIFPSRDDLKAIVQYFPLDVSRDTYLTKRPTYQDTYRALLLDNDDGATKGGSAITAKREADPRDEEHVFTLQLVEIPSEKISYKQGGAIFRFTDSENAVRGLLQTLCDEETRKSPEIGQIQIQMEPIDKAVTKLDSLVIPFNTKLIDVPGYIQEHAGGLYTSGVGSFIQRNTWYVFPVFDTSRFTKTTRRLKIIQLGGLKAPVSDQTFAMAGDELTVVCTTSSKMQDISVSAQMNAGLGTRFIKADQMFEMPTAGEPNKEAFNRQGVTADFKTGDRSDGNNVALYSDNMITSNIVNEYAKIAPRKGQLFITIWQRSLARLIYPGMPMRLYYDQDGVTKIYDGVVLQVDEQSTSEANGMIQKAMISTAALVCFINKEEARSNG